MKKQPALPLFLTLSFLLLISCGNGGGGSGSSGTGTEPSAPTNLQAEAVSNTSISVTWTDTSNNETSFRLERSTSCSSGFTLASNISANVQGYLDVGLNPNAFYCYRVVAVNGNEYSEYSPTAGTSTWATPTHNLTVNKAGTGSGSIIGTGINCGTDCADGYSEGAAVTLTANADSGSSFLDWNGCDDPSGVQCIMTMDQDKTVTANFATVFSSAVQITSLPTSSDTGNYALTWACSGLCSTTSIIQEDDNTSFSSPTPYYAYYGVMTYQFTAKPDGTYCYRVKNANPLGWSEPACITVARTTSAVLRIANNTHYAMIDIRLNGSQMVAYPYGIAPGDYYDFVFPNQGSVSYYLGVGFYDEYGGRDIWYETSGNTNVSTGSTMTLPADNPTIGQVLSQFGTSHDWSGQYWCYSCNPIVGYKTYRFTNAGNWTLYDNGSYQGSGIVTLVEWLDFSTYVKFKFCSSCPVITMWYPFANFQYANGPGDWPIIWYDAQ